MNRIRKRLTYANVMSSIAVFLVIGGATAFAALGKNTVGSKQLKKNAVTTTKIKNETITNAKIKKGTIAGSSLNLGTIGTVPSATDAIHATSADKATLADKANLAVNATHAFSADNSTNLPTVLAIGQTLTGTVSDATDAPAPGTISSQNVSFPIPLSVPPNVHIIDQGQSPPAGCSGTPEEPKADSGNLCIFIALKEGPVGLFSAINPENPETAQPGSGRRGFFLYNNSTGSGRDQWWGSWAVTG